VGPRTERGAGPKGSTPSSQRLAAPPSGSAGGRSAPRGHGSSRRANSGREASGCHGPRVRHPQTEDVALGGSRTAGSEEVQPASTSSTAASITNRDLAGVPSRNRLTRVDPGKSGTRWSSQAQRPGAGDVTKGSPQGSMPMFERSQKRFWVKDADGDTSTPGSVALAT